MLLSNRDRGFIQNEIEAQYDDCFDSRLILPT